jgi:hypothetical protein
LTHIKFNKEERETLQLGLNYAIEEPTTQIIQNLVIDTENAIRQLHENEQNTYRHLACIKIKQIKYSTTTNTLHKRQRYIMKQISKKLQQNNLTITKADKGRTIVIINKDWLIQKTEKFLKGNNFTQLPKDPTHKYQRTLQNTIPKCNKIIDQHQKKYLMQIKPQAPNMNVRIKLHKENEPIRPVVNNTQAPTYKIAKYRNKWLPSQIQLYNTYITHNSTQLATELKKLNINEYSRMITLDIKDLYVNIPIKEIIRITRNLMTKNMIDNTTVTQTITLLDTILSQNYLMFDNKYYQPNKGVAMGSPISALVAEILLQHYEENLLKNILDNSNIIYYNRYVDDILIIYDHSKTNNNEIEHYINNIHPELIFTATDELNNSINFLDLKITRKQKELDINIYRKPTTTDTTIHYTSNHPIQHKLAAYRFLLNRVHNLPMSNKHKQQEMNTILHIAQNNGYPTKLINRLNTQIKTKTTTQKNSLTNAHNNNRKWATFEYSNPIIRKVTNIFKNTNLKISFHPCNFAQNILKTHPETTNTYNNSGIYSIQCNTCKRHYVGQTGRNLATRFTEHTRYIKNNDPKSAYALHILNNNHEYGPIHDTMHLLKTCSKVRSMTTMENFYIQTFHKQGILIEEQYATENPLFHLIDSPHQPTPTPAP